MNLSCAYMGYSYDEDRSVQLMVIAAIMLACSLPTVVINYAILMAIWKKNELKTPTYYIIGNLAFSDCLSGCSAYIFYAVVCILFALGRDACNVASIGTPLSYILGITSYCTIVLQTVERYIAVFFPFWYHSHFTTNIALIGNAVAWLLALCLVTLWITTKNNQLFNGILAPVCFICLIINLFCYLRVFKEVRKIEKDMLNQQVLSREERKNVRRNSKVAKATAIILLAFLTCYTPLLLLIFYLAFHHETTKFADDTLYWVWVLSLLNSLVNPVVACRQLKVLKGAVLNNFKICRKRTDVYPIQSPMTIFISSRKSRVDTNLNFDVVSKEGSHTLDNNCPLKTSGL